MWQTSVGAKATVTSGANTFEVAAVSNVPDVDRFAPSNLDRTQVRWQAYHKGVTYGLSGAFDTSGLGRDERLVSADVRWAVPEWIARGVVLGYSNDSQEFTGFFIDLYYRATEWEDLTLVFRHEQLDRAVLEDREVTTLGTKLRTPFDTSLYVNYNFGPNINELAFGGAWSIGLIKTFRF
jgi:hypothetical protein